MYERIQKLIESTRFGSSLRAKAMRGGAWLGAGSVAEQSARFARNLILARLLAPSAFGTMAVVLSVSTVLGSLTDVGVREALVQNPRGGERQYANAAWWMAFGRAIATYFFLFLAAPWVARLYENPELSLLLRVAVLGLLFEGAMSAQAYVSLKQMKFSKWTAILNGGGIAGVVITVILSFFIRDVWALVIGSCTESVARCVLSYIICPFFPSLQWDREVFRDLLTFSRKMFGLSVLHLVFLRTDVFVLAKLLSSADLGLYTMAVYLIQVPAAFIINVLGQLLVPTFSGIQGDTERTNRIVLQVSRVGFVIGLPVLAMLFFCGRPLLILIYGSPYASAAPSLVVASWVALINILNGPITGVFYATGRPEWHRRCVAVMAASMILLIYPLAKFLGPVGGQVACLIAISAGFLLQVERIWRANGFRIVEYGKALLFSVAVSSIVVVACLAGARIVPPAPPYLTVALGMTACLLAYGIGLYSWSRFFDVDKGFLGAPPCRPKPLQEISPAK